MDAISTVAPLVDSVIEALEELLLDLLGALWALSHPRIMLEGRWPPDD